MADVFTSKKRSEIMSKIRSKNTRPELLVFRELRKRKIYFYKHYAKIPGKPDIALPRKKIAVFIDGDFWHGYKFKIQRQRLPRKYWVKKIENNIIRDRKVSRELRRMGWQVLRIWEHEIRLKQNNALSKIAKLIAWQ